MALELIGVRATIEGLNSYLAGGKAVQGATDAMGKSAEKAGNLAANLSKGLGLAAVAAGGFAAAFGGASIASASRFQTILAQVDALTNTTSEDTDRLGKGILELSKRIPKSPDELGTAAYFALSSGITDVDEALKLVESAGKAASLGLGSTKDIVDVLTATINAYGKENITAAQATDQLIAVVREGKGEPAQLATAFGSLVPLAAALKVPFADLGGVLASLTNTMGGPDGTFQATTQLRGILSQLAGPSDAAKKALAETGQFASIMTTEFEKATASTEDVASAQTDLKQAQAALNIAQKENAAILKSAKPDSVEYQKAQLALSRATQAVDDAQRKLTKTQGDSVGKTKQTADAFGSLRKEVAEKGLVPALLHLRDAFAGNLEGLATIFPDIRGFIGFLSAIESQGDATAQIVQRVRASAGLTDDAFARMSKTFDFQVKLLRNQLSVALIKLGSEALPFVTSAVEKLLAKLPQLEEKAGALAHLFGLGFNGGKIGGDFDTISKAAFGAGEKLAGFIKLISENKDTILQAGALEFKGLENFISFLINNIPILTGILAVGGGLFAISNPIWAGILVGGAILGGIALLSADLEGLTTPLLHVRAGIDELMLKLVDVADTASTLGLNKLFGIQPNIPIPGVELPSRTIERQAKQDLAEINRLLANRTQETNALAEANKKAAAAGISLDRFFRETFTALTALGPGTGDTALSIGRLVFAYDSLKKHTGSAFSDFPGLQRVVEELGTTLDMTGNKATAASGQIAHLIPPDIGNTEAIVQAETDIQQVGASAEIARGHVARIIPPNVGDAGILTQTIQQIDAIGTAAESISRAIAGIGAKAAAQVGGFQSLASGATSSLQSIIQKALELAGQIARITSSTIGGLIGRVTKITSHASGGIVSHPEISWLGESGPEAVLPLSNASRAREIVASLPPSFRQSVFNSANFSPSIVMQGATLDQQRSALHRFIDDYFNNAKSHAFRAGASLNGQIA